MATLQESAYQLGLLLNQTLQSGGATTSSVSLQRIEAKLDTALLGAATTTLSSRPVLRDAVLRSAKLSLSRQQQRGMNRDTGRLLIGIEHLQQSIRQILLTALGTRVMRRPFGCGLLDMIGQPYNTTTILQIYNRVADALRQWEPRFTLRKITPKWLNRDEQFTDQLQGQLQLTLVGDYHGQSIRLAVRV